MALIRDGYAVLFSINHFIDEKKGLEGARLRPYDILAKDQEELKRKIAEHREWFKDRDFRVEAIKHPVTFNWNYKPAHQSGEWFPESFPHTHQKQEPY